VRNVASSALAILLLLLSCGSPSGGTMDKSVSIGTHKLHIYCIGAGSPAIVIDVGAGESYTSWQSVQEELAQDTRVCAYDRAGYGQSEPGPMPRDSQRAADELHQLLLDSGEEGPFLLVGHSLGGLNMQVFAASYPEQVAGVVLLDPTPQGWMMGEGFPELRELFRQGTASMQDMADAARISSDPGERAKVTLFEAMASEHEEIFAQTAQQIGAISSYGQLPLTVIGASDPDPRFGESSAAFRQFWNSESRKLAAKSEKGRFVLAEGSSHHIHLDAPQLVMDAIHEMLLESRR
jgi:pimeloyl-ACP methyl ester carboxylesterase